LEKSDVVRFTLHIKYAAVTNQNEIRPTTYGADRNTNFNLNPLVSEAQHANEPI